MTNGGLVLDGDLEEATEEAFIEGRFVEAFALLHSYIEWLMVDLYRLHQAIGLGENVHELEAPVNENPSWQDSLNRLFENDAITKEEYKHLRKFNELRNKIVRRLILPAYQMRKEKVTRSEAFDVFMNAKELIFMLKARSKSLTFRSQTLYQDEMDHKLLG